MRRWMAARPGSTNPAADGFCQTQCTYDMPILVDPADPLTVYTGGGGSAPLSGGVETTPSSFMKSTDGGATFVSRVRGSNPASAITALHADVHAITAWPGHAGEVWVGNDGGVWRSTNGAGVWQNLNTNLQVTQFQGCDLDPVNPAHAYGGTQDNGTNGWAGSSAWPHLDFGDGGFALIDQTNPANLVHTYFNQTQYLLGVGFTTSGFSTTQGGYFGSFSDDPATTTDGNGIGWTDRVLFYAPIHLDRGVHDTLYFGTNKLNKADAFFSQTVDSNGNGQPGIFHPLGSGATGQDLAPGGALSAIETVANAPGLDAQIIFTGSSNGHVFRSVDSGVSFTEVDVTPTLTAQYVSDIVVNPRNSQVVFQTRAGFTGATPTHNVRKSVDGGLTWADSSNGMPDIPANALAFDPIAPNTIWVGTDIGAYLSTDGGATWNPYSNGLPNVAVFDLKTSAFTHTILACTHGRGAFRLDLDAIFIDGFDGL